MGIKKIHGGNFFFEFLECMLNFFLFRLYEPFTKTEWRKPERLNIYELQIFHPKFIRLEFR